MRPIETQRLWLKSFEEKYIYDLFEYASSPVVGPAAGWEPHSDINASRATMKSFIETDENYMLIYKPLDKLIGSVGIHNDTVRGYKNSREIGYVLSDKYWGMGIMPEAVRAVLAVCFMDMGLDIVTVGHFPSNYRSRRVIEKLGFSAEGLAVGAFRRADGEVFDELRYRMTKDDYIRIYGK